jgi:hypothetical protein
MKARMTDSEVKKFNDALFKRASWLGIVSQVEMFHRCELELERTMKHWEWHEGRYVGGPFFYIPAWMKAQ